MIKHRQPLRKGVANVPVILQLEALECGAACLAMVLAYYHKWIPLEQMRIDCGVSRNGSNLKNIYNAARHYGLEAHGYRMELEEIRKTATFPCILHWNFNHFVVLCGFLGKYAILNDPARGIVRVGMEEFDRSFTGMCLFFAPGDNFVPSGKRKTILNFARARLKGAASAVAFITLTSVIAYLFGIINPVMSRLFFDKLLTGVAPAWTKPLLAAMTVLAVFQLIVEWEKTVYMLKIDGKMAIEGNSDFMWKVLHLPMEFFSQRMAGDLLQRQATNSTISGTLVKTVAPLLLDTFMMFFYLFVMIRYSTLMTVIGLVTLLLHLIIAKLLSNKRENVNRVYIRDVGKLAGATLAGIRMAETLKSSGSESGFFRKWSGLQATVNTQRIRFNELSAHVAMIMQFIQTAGSYLVVIFGVQQVMRGHFTVGMITTFQGLLNAFMEPAGMLVSARQTIQEMRIQMERVEDVMAYPEDPVFSSEEMPVEESSKKLSGELEIRHLTFGYSRLAEPEISDFSMHLKPGCRIAIVGPSGCGKSTISKLITGLYQPWEGEILFDGKPMREIPRYIFTGSVAMIDQDVVLFEDTIANNIRMWDKSIEDFEVILAARDAQIHDDIVQRPGGYQSCLLENGKDLSGGQRQRLEVARALAQDPSILIMDEATSALDARTEYDLVNAIRERRISCIIVAHRLSTIRDCDEIIVLDKGKVVERGTHETLLAKGGAYTELVTSE